MNILIKKLIQDATTTHINEDGAGFHNFSKEKFSHLIVEHCAAIVSLYKRDNMQDKAIADTLEHAYREMKLAFGLKP